MLLPSDVQVPVRRWLLSVPVRVTIHPSGDDAPESSGAEEYEEHTAENFPATLDDKRERPSERHERASADCQE